MSENSTKSGLWIKQLQVKLSCIKCCK